MRITHRFLSFRWFVGLLTHLFRLRVWSPLTISRLTANALLQPSLRAMTALPMTGFHRVQDLPCTENNTLESQLLSEFCRVLAISNVQTAVPAMDSFRVRDSHPIPLFSEQECVSDCSGRACATKAMVFSLLYARLFYAHKKTSPALLSRRQKKSRILCIFGLIVRKNYLFI